MNDDSAIEYRVDRADRLVSFGDAWLRFAAANEGMTLEPSRIRGHSLWEYLDPTTAHLYRRMIDRLRESGTPIRFSFRCDAPDCRRLLAMEMTADVNSDIHFVVTPVTEATRVAVPLLEPGRPRSDEFVTICAWCKRVELPSGRWCEVEEAVATLELFQRETLPQLTHGACSDCADAIMELIDDQDLGAGGSVVLGALPLG